MLMFEFPKRTLHSHLSLSWQEGFASQPLTLGLAISFAIADETSLIRTDWKLCLWSWAGTVEEMLTIEQKTPRKSQNSLRVYTEIFTIKDRQGTYLYCSYYSYSHIIYLPTYPSSTYVYMHNTYSISAHIHIKCQLLPLGYFSWYCGWNIQYPPVSVFTVCLNVYNILDVSGMKWICEHFIMKTFDVLVSFSVEVIHPNLIIGM